MRCVTVCLIFAAGLISFAQCATPEFSAGVYTAGGSPPTGYILASLADVKSTKFITSYNANRLPFLGGTSVCCFITIQGGFLSYPGLGSIQLFSSVSSPNPACSLTAQQGYYLGQIYRGTAFDPLMSADVDQFSTTQTVDECSTPSTQTSSFAIYKSTSTPSPTTTTAATTTTPASTTIPSSTILVSTTPSPPTEAPTTPVPASTSAPPVSGVAVKGLLVVAGSFPTTNATTSTITPAVVNATTTDLSKVLNVSASQVTIDAVTPGNKSTNISFTVVVSPGMTSRIVNTISTITASALPQLGSYYLNATGQSLPAVVATVTGIMNVTSPPSGGNNLTLASSSSSLSGGGIAGIVIACLVVAVLAALGIYLLFFRGSTNVVPSSPAA